MGKESFGCPAEDKALNRSKSNLAYFVIHQVHTSCSISFAASTKNLILTLRSGSQLQQFFPYLYVFHGVT